MLYEIIPTKVFRRGAEVLTYAYDGELVSGQVVEVPLGKQKCVGVVLRRVKLSDPEFQIKEIEQVSDYIIPKWLMRAVKWMAEYYLVDLVSVFKMILPNGNISSWGRGSLGPSSRASDRYGVASLPRPKGRTAVACAMPQDETVSTSQNHSACAMPQGERISPDDIKSIKTTQGRVRVARLYGDATLWLGRGLRNALSSHNPLDISGHICCAMPQGDAIKLNKYQRRAIGEIKGVESATKLLRGVTGSGKTNIYLILAREQMEQGKSVILLVPEISLTSQLVGAAKEFFGERVQVLHSRQTEATRRKLWVKIVNEAGPQLVIGPRSALFAPVRELGLIIIDEAHESTYTQEKTPKYSALRVASFIAGSEKISAILGTATPLVADYYLASKHGAVVELKQKAKDTAIDPEVRIVDMKDRGLFKESRYLSVPLVKKITQNLEQGYQTLIFHNRRGSAPLTICEGCGWQALCPNCFLPLTLHMDGYCLRCHICGHTEAVPKACPECKGVNIVHKGFGTKLLENEVGRLFPKARVARFDADNKKSESLDALYDEVREGKIDIIVGTQTVAKGLDLPRLATVGVVQADAGLSLPDYAAEEKAFHLLTQVLGRVGRGHIAEASAIIQTYQPDSPIIAAAINDDYEAFSKHLLEKRKKGGLPPYRYLAKVTMTYKTERVVLKNIQRLRAELARKPGVEVSVPMPAFHERTATGYNWQIVLKARSRGKLLEAVRGLKLDKNLHLELDPPSLL